MTYNRDEIYKKCLKLIPQKEITFIDELAFHLPCDRATFYRLFAQGSDEMGKIKELIEKNKTLAKQGLREKWYNGDNATCQIALYKLLSTKEERDLLADRHDYSGEIDHKHSFSSIMDEIRKLKNGQNPRIENNR